MVDPDTEEEVTHTEAARGYVGECASQRAFSREWELECRLS
jgi:hypothetical protein